MYYYYHARISPIRKEAVAFQASLWVGMTRIKDFIERPGGSKWALQCTNSSILITIVKNASLSHQYPSSQGYSSNQLKTVSSKSYWCWCQLPRWCSFLFQDCWSPRTTALVVGDIGCVWCWETYFLISSQVMMYETSCCCCCCNCCCWLAPESNIGR